MIELKKNEYAEVILNQLYKHTQMQVTFGAIMLALVDQRPQYLTLKQMMELFLQHRRNVIIRRTKYLLNKAEARDHIVQGLLIALDNIDAVVSLIRASQTLSNRARRTHRKFFPDRTAGPGHPGYALTTPHWSGTRKIRARTPEFVGRNQTFASPAR